MQLAVAAENAAHGVEHGATYHPPHHFLLDLGGVTVHLNTIMASWFAMIVLIVLFSWASKNLQKKPDGKQTFFETVLEFIHSIVTSQIHKDTYRYVPLIGTIFLFVLVSNWMGLIPWKIIELSGIEGFEIASPTNDLNTTAALALISLVSYIGYGLKKKGFGYFKHYLTPHPLLFPLNLMEDITRPLSLAFRLFGNIIGGEIVIGILLFLTAPFVITTVVALPMFALEVFVGVIQAYIFAILTASYIGAAVAEHH